MSAAIVKVKAVCMCVYMCDLLWVQDICICSTGYLYLYR